LLGFSGDRCRLRVTCSKGTYIRSLAEDLGRALDCGAHLTALRRVAVGDLAVAQAVTLDDLAALSEAVRERCWLLPPDTLLQSLPAVTLDEESATRFANGNPVGGGVAPGKCRVYGLGRLLGLGEVDDQGRVQPRRVIGSA